MKVVFVKKILAFSISREGNALISEFPYSQLVLNKANLQKIKKPKLKKDFGQLIKFELILF